MYRKILLLAAAPALLLASSGCGAIASPGSENRLAITSAKVSLDTTTSTQLTAHLGLEATPQATPEVQWSIAGGQNSPAFGQGSISAAGLYTPPALLSRDSVQIDVRAATRNAPVTTAVYSLTVTPGFVQVLSPETASLPPGGTVQVTGQIAQINGGSVHWSLANTPGGGVDPGDSYGSINNAHCVHSTRNYTSCTATYTAPRSLPAGGPALFLVGRAGASPRSVASLHILLNGAGFTTSALENQAPQTGYVELGTSGGNANDYDSRRDPGGKEYVNDCCGGTLGALVADKSNNLYILSNNHVLAESDQARSGDTIVHPALVDLNCNPQAGRTVGSLRTVVPLQSRQTNVDAALAAATPAVDSTGAILQMGPLINGSLTAGAPAGGGGEPLTADLLNQIRVAKSGRTTGLTCSTIGAVSLTVQVDYYYDCAETRPYYTKTYTNQIGIPGFSFADSGDSGALVVDAANAQPVGLFFASGADDSNHGFSVANPIQDVLTELGTTSQQELRIAGGAPHPVTCSNYDEHPGSTPHPLTTFQAALAKTAAESQEASLLRQTAGILGLAAGQSEDHPGEGAVILYVDRDKPPAAIPQLVDGVRTLVIPTDSATVGAGTAPLLTPQLEGMRLSAGQLRAAVAAQAHYVAQVMRDPAFFAVGVTQSYDNPAEAALLVLEDLARTPQSMPAILGGLRVRYLRVNRLHVTRSKLAPTERTRMCLPTNP